MRTNTGRVLLVMGIVLTTLALRSGQKKYQATEYPFGWSHSCDKALFVTLVDYAHAHDGAFPTGGVTPEASLSMIAAGQDPADFDVLRGKSIPAEVVLQQLRNFGELTPATCGWHYVEGLTLQDSGCALFWDKDGLGHNGERLAGGGHIVTFTGGDQEHVTADRWAAFLADQAKLRAKLTADRSFAGDVIGTRAANE